MMENTDEYECVCLAGLFKPYAGHVYIHFAVNTVEWKVYQKALLKCYCKHPENLSIIATPILFLAILEKGSNHRWVPSQFSPPQVY